MQLFYKRADARYVALIFDGASDPSYVGPGFQMSSSNGLFPPPDRPTGIDLYPAAFSWPNGDENHLAAIKKRHWPSIVMTIGSMNMNVGGGKGGKEVQEAFALENVAHVYDQRVRELS
jgi:hypothetical protein